MAKRFYDLTVAGCKRSLPILNLSDSLAIAGFVMLGDVELCESCARELAKKVPAEAEIIMTAETKGIPLAAELARQIGMPYYITARKSVKAYMEDPIWVEDESITTMGKQRLYLMRSDIDRIAGRKVLLLDDVMSELDADRRAALLSFIRSEEIQTFITATDAAYFPSERMGTYRYVENGQIREM